MCPRYKKNIFCHVAHCGCLYVITSLMFIIFQSFQEAQCGSIDWFNLRMSSSNYCDITPFAFALSSLALAWFIYHSIPFHNNPSIASKIWYDILINNRCGTIPCIDMLMGPDLLIILRLKICQRMYSNMMYAMSTMSSNSCYCNDCMEDNLCDG